MQSVHRSEHERVTRLSGVQEGLWLLHQLDDMGSAYNEPFAIRLRGAVNADAIERSITEIVRRHESLRTHVQEDAEGRAFQVPKPVSQFRFIHLDFSHHAHDERSAQLSLHLQEQAARRFDLLQDLPLRAGLIKLSDTESVLYYVVHHIQWDLWSAVIFLRELEALYPALCRGEGSPLPDLKLQYSDYVLWQREQLKETVLRKQLDYWKRQLAGIPAQLDLPTDRPRQLTNRFNGAQVQFAFPAELTRALYEFARRRQVTLYMVLLAAFKAVLARWSGQHDFAVGSPVAGRQHAQAQQLIGFFANMLVLRADVSADPTFETLLERVKRTTLEALAHQDVPLERLVAELNPERDPARQPLFQVVFALQNVPLRWPTLPHLAIDEIPIRQSMTKFDLSVDVVQSAGALAARVEFASDLFESPTIERFIDDYRSLLARAVTDPSRRLSQLVPVESPAANVLVGSIRKWNCATEFRSVPQLIEEQAARTPDAIAVAHGGDTLTYRQLSERSAALASNLVRKGMDRDVLVAVYLERSIELVVAVLSILKAGGAYVPLDPHYPRERIRYMLTDACAALVLTRGSQVAQVRAAHATIECYEIDSTQTCERSAEVTARAAAGDLAYCIYTSGSTGAPKATAVAHASLLNHNLYFAELAGLRAGDRVLQFASLSFDASAEEIFPTLIAGATLILLSHRHLAHEEMTELMHRERITVLNLPTAYWHEWVDWLSATAIELPVALRLLVVGGEKVQAAKFMQWRKLNGTRQIRWLNSYGPTECTITCSVFEPEPDEDYADIPIGRPISNATLHVLDADLNPVPRGARGELCIGGDCLARGYLHRPALTAERFCAAPFHAGERLYRTGDLVRCNVSGNLEYLGRIDRQIKLRGFRVEPAEIEAELLAFPSIAQAVVTLSGAARPQLTAYIVRASGSEAPTTEALRAHLQRALPPYMLPASFLELERLPLTLAGKIDLQRLPAAKQTDECGGVDVEPASPLERQIAEIWRQVLQIERLGSHDNFFDLGGDSLLAMRVIARMRASGLELPLRVLFEQPDVARVSTWLEQHSSARPQDSLTRSAEPLTDLEEGTI